MKFGCDDSMCGWTHSHCAKCNLDMDGNDKHHYLEGKITCTTCFIKHEHTEKWRRAPERTGEASI